ncbi:MAG: tRNA (N(6)-L-threonylcarbamoyladenosine(37)-C(2))-methylthiotransferase MtaB [Bacilli bacterium]|jgi:threonylcarbamoyladenosine tRNA methylthiotransferase MtaB|nr:tRNA (N(6)-L-threonylcarbamoyladenosine(37)-C(2))-methylthiotransferase MtaB [Bacilli bacterium]
MPSDFKSTFSIITFGCKVNAYESEAIREEMEKAGFVFVKEPPSFYIIINTCAVTLTAEKKDLEKIRSLSRLFPEAKLVILGCFSQLHPEKLLPFTSAELILGTKDRKKIPELLKLNQKYEGVDKNSRLFSYEETPISAFRSDYRAFLKIQDGCDNFCSYCIIPLTRGISRSRKGEDILKEAARLANNGYKEIGLTGIDVGSYDDQGLKLSDLVEKLLQVTPSSFRLRIGSLEMSQVDEKLIEILKNNKRLVPHLHLPLQSGSERILELMGRKYDLKEFNDLLSRLKREIPDLALSTDVIVGFPSECEDDFLKTVEFIKKAGFMRLHVFPYSPRPFTKASKMAGQLSMSLKKERVRRLSKIGEELAASYLSSYRGKTLSVLLEEELKGEDGYRLFRGYSENYLDLKVKSKENLLGQIVSGTCDGKGYLNYPSK